MFLGIDLGTSAVKLLLIDKTGKIIKTSSKEYKLYYLNGNWAEQNPEDWWNGVLEGFEEILDENVRENLEAISFSGQMHGLVVLDREDKVIRPAILWCDQRTEKQCEVLNKIPNLGNITGNKALTGFTAPKILWIRENERENFSRINKIMLPKDYIAYKLSGIHGIDVSDGSGTLMMNVKERKWAEEIIDFLDIKKENLGKIYESQEVIGQLKEELKNKYGLKKDVKIVMGGGDQAIGAVGVGAIEEGILSVALGTSGVIFSSTDKYRVDREYRLHSFCDANMKYHQMGVILSAAGALKWWVEDINQSKDYDYYNKIAEETLPGGEGLYFLPYLIGERTPHNNPNVKGSFIGLTHNHRKGHMTRAVLEGVAYALKDSFVLLEEMNIDIKKVLISGGGSKSKLWKQIIGDVLNKPIITIDSSGEGPALGAAIVAAVGCGVFENLEEGCKAIINEVEITYPIEENVSIYEKNYEKFKLLYPMLEEFWR